LSRDLKIKLPNHLKPSTGRTKAADPTLRKGPTEHYSERRSSSGYRKKNRHRQTPICSHCERL